MTHRLATNYAKNYCNRTLTVKVIVENVATCFFGTRCIRTVYRRSLPKPGIVSTQKTTTDNRMITTDHRATIRAAIELSGYSISSHTARLYRFTGRGFVCTSKTARLSWFYAAVKFWLL